MLDDSFLYRIAHFVVIWPTLVNNTLCHCIMINASIWLILLPESIYLGIIWWILGIILVICTPYLWCGEFCTDVTADVQMTKNDRKMRTRITEHGSEFLRAFCVAGFPMYCTVHIEIVQVGNSIGTMHVHEEFPCTMHTYMYEVAYVPGKVHESWNLYLGNHMDILEMIWELEKVENPVQNAGTSLSAENSTSQNRS